MPMDSTQFNLFERSTPRGIVGDNALLEEAIVVPQSRQARRWMERGASVPVDDGIIVDLFAGGGGATEGIEMAIGRPVDIAVNHDHNALLLHSINHPETEHYIEDVFKVDPIKACRGRPVAALWASPTCTHYSRARSATPLDYHEARRIRGLAWIIVKWAATVRPKVIYAENVPEFLSWGRLGKDGTADKSRRGEYFRKWVRRLEDLGYRVEWKVIKAADHGSPTIRERVYIVARCDGGEIRWPAPTHGPGLERPHRDAASILDWSHEGSSIFGRKKKLKPNSLKRIAAVVVRHILKADNPFVVPRPDRAEILRMPSISIHRGGRTGASVTQPLHTITSGAGSKRAAGAAHALGVVEVDAIEMAAMAQHNLGVIGRPVTEPLSTLVKKCSQQQLVTATMTSFYSSNNGSAGDLRKPLGTILSGGQHHAVIEAACESASSSAAARQVAAFLKRYYVPGKREAAPSFDVLQGVMTYNGRRYQITDIRCRMIEPRECFRAQGFSDDYIIDPVCTYKTRAGKYKRGRLPRHEQVAKCGNSVCPQVAEALVRANSVSTVSLAEAA